jgi:hypothetical protein
MKVGTDGLTVGKLSVPYLHVFVNGGSFFFALMYVASIKQLFEIDNEK